ncbi:hypothetical protein H5410_046964 [Solanum commersonii]|uniref:Uncharacterized protein n=1 Tax=Solanum commersonii TaxID=4109 RepID=A0A9J5XFW3_SOLCO|nr:hypothetical protein H5410_046964 [Solanum commersonii]
MISTISWNARSISTQGALARLQKFKDYYNLSMIAIIEDRLQKLKDYYNLSMIAILEPKTNKHQLNYYKNQLRMDNATSYSNNKIWLFWNQDVDCTILDQDEQQVTCEAKHVAW